MSPTPARTLTIAERACAVSMAAASDINDELTIILNAADELSEFIAADEIKAAVQRIAWKCSGVLNYATRRGVRASAVHMERLILEDDSPTLAALVRRY